MKLFTYIFFLVLLASCIHKPVTEGTRIGNTALTVEIPEGVVLDVTQPVDDFYLLYFVKNDETFLSMYVGNAPNFKKKELYDFSYSSNYLQHFCLDDIETLDCYIKMAFDFPKYIKYKSVNAEHSGLVKTIVNSLKVNESWLRNGKN